MNEWPSEWFRDAGHRGYGAREGDGGQAGQPGTPGTPGAAGAPEFAADPTVRMSAGERPAAAGEALASPRGAWPQQPPVQSAGGPGGSRQPGLVHRAGGGRRRPRARLVIAIVAALVALVLVVAAGGYFYLDSRLARQNILVDFPGRPAAGSGSNWLITGSDSRQGLTRKQERQLHTGRDIAGHRSDTILVLHIPANGNRPVLLSIPRDSYVQIPGYGSNKINAAFSFGGPRLLAKTIQNATGLRIDHYMGIGFGGLVNVVDAVGGVNMCFKHALHDRAAGLHLKKGCQTLTGGKALGFVRTRHQFSSQDLQREQNQRVFIKALLSKMTSFGTLINPFVVIPAALGATSALTVDSGTHLYQLISVAFALRHPETTTVPVANASFPTSAGDAVQWNQASAQQLFNDLKFDRKVPKSLLTGSRLAG